MGEVGGGGRWWVGVGGWLDQVGLRLFQLPTKLKLKLSLSLETTFLVGVGGWVAGWLEKTGIKLSHLQS